MNSENAAGSVASLFARYGEAYRWLATATVMMGTIATILTATIVNVALPDIMGAFGMGQDKAQLLSTGFLAAMTGTMLLNAWMVESFGKRATYMFSVSSFIFASILGGMAPSESVLILSRVLQGAAAGLIQPLAMQVIFEVFPPNKRGSAMGIFGIGVVLAPAIGPALGGFMVDAFSWRYVFFMAVPFCVVGLFLGVLFLPQRPPSTSVRGFDWVGFGLLVVFLVTLLNGLSNGQRFGWMSDRILIDFVAAFLCGLGFILWEIRAHNPMLNVKLFVNPVYAGASVVSFIFGAGLFGSTFLVPLFVQTMQGYTPTRSGLLLMPGGLVLAAIFPIAGWISDRAPSHLLIMSGLFVFAVSSLLMTSVDVNTSFWLFAWWIIVGRVGLGFIMPSLNAGALKALPIHLLGQGTGAINFVRQLGGALGVNLLSISLERRSQVYVDGFVVTQEASNGATAELLQGISSLLAQEGLSEPIRQAGAMHFLGMSVYAQGNMLGYRDSFLIVGVIFLIALIPALIMRQGGPPSILRLPTQRRVG